MCKNCSLRMLYPLVLSKFLFLTKSVKVFILPIFFLSPFFIFLKSLKTSFYPSLLPVHLKVFKKSFKKSFYPPLLPLHLKPQLSGELLAVHRLVGEQPADLAWKRCKNIQIQIQIQKYTKVQRLV